MGGVRARMRRTELCFLSGTFALAGIPALRRASSARRVCSASGSPTAPGACPGALHGRPGHQRAHRPLRVPLWATVFRGEPQTARVYAAHEAPPHDAGAGADPGRARRRPRRGARRLGAAHPRQPPHRRLRAVPVAGLHHASVGPVAVDPAPGRRCSPASSARWLAARGRPGRRGCGCSADPSRAAVVERLPRALPQLSYTSSTSTSSTTRPWCGPPWRWRAACAGWSSRGSWTAGCAAWPTPAPSSGACARDYQTGLIRDYASYMIAAAGVFVVATIVLVSR